MSDTICGVDCAQCSMKDVCGGCAETNGRPFGGECVVAECCKGKGSARCEGCGDAVCGAAFTGEAETLCFIATNGAK